MKRACQHRVDDGDRNAEAHEGVDCGSAAGLEKIGERILGADQLGHSGGAEHHGDQRYQLDEDGDHQGPENGAADPDRGMTGFLGEVDRGPVAVVREQGGRCVGNHQPGACRHQHTAIAGRRCRPQGRYRLAGIEKTHGRQDGQCGNLEEQEGTRHPGVEPDVEATDDRGEQNDPDADGSAVDIRPQDSQVGARSVGQNRHDENPTHKCLDE